MQTLSEAPRRNSPRGAELVRLEADRDQNVELQILFAEREFMSAQMRSTKELARHYQVWRRLALF